MFNTFDSCAHLRNHQHNRNIKHSHHPQNILCSPLMAIPPSTPSPRQPPTLIFVTLLLVCISSISYKCKYSVCNTLMYGFYSEWLKYICAVAQVSSHCSLLLISTIVVICGYATFGYLFTYDGHVIFSLGLLWIKLSTIMYKSIWT